MRIEGLYGLADPSLRPDLTVPDLCAALAEGGAAVVQIRWKGGSAREILEAARAALPLVRAHGTALVINDRPDIALLAGADGVHMGAEDLPVDEVRRWVGDRLRIGATVRDLAEARAAAAAGADHVGFGPVFSTTTKVVDAPPRGLEALREVAAGSPIPVVAIAGIGAENIASVAAAGAHAAAVGSALLRVGQPDGPAGLPAIVERARELARRFEAGRR